MCNVLDRIENKGRVEGEKNKAKATAIRLHARGFSNADIAELVEEEVSTVQSWVEPAKV